MTKQPADEEEWVCRVCTKKKQKAAQYQAYKARLAQKKVETSGSAGRQDVSPMKIKQEPFDPEDKSMNAFPAPVVIKKEVCETVVPMETDEIVSVVSTPAENSPVGMTENEAEQMEVSEAGDGKKAEGQLESIPEEGDSIPSSIEKMLATVEKELDTVLEEAVETLEETVEEVVEEKVEETVAHIVDERVKSSEDASPHPKSAYEEIGKPALVEMERKLTVESLLPPSVTPALEVAEAPLVESPAATPPILTPKAGSPQPPQSSVSREEVSAPIIDKGPVNTSFPTNQPTTAVQEVAFAPSIAQRDSGSPRSSPVVEMPDIAKPSEVSQEEMPLAPPSITRVSPIQVPPPSAMETTAPVVSQAQESVKEMVTPVETVNKPLSQSGAFMGSGDAPRSDGASLQMSDQS